MSTLDEIELEFANWQQEDAKFRAGNKSAGTRARKALMELTKAAKTRRKEITDIKNA